ncbi:hypothetical protein LMG31884_47550 (plasmid) [Xanthomonas hydrangeae]|nr:hypothetical protein LMG31884_47550 [Xanthomonas hydrangeae]CAD7741318.1 hypothetical protein LMG31884_47550 [Xanthomonas hydrangeae]CAD7747918.1 hypothetical protein LMG31887_46300 [Xanthomonas hydrangeae]CAD7747919.1 hypothetical protein LMG31887_46300 [Xanthomonas hydrangeae]CAD7748204.1 hypothetical protein LMG31885_45190 [Xanthomonas hydrangeae]
MHTLREKMEAAMSATEEQLSQVSPSAATALLGNCHHRVKISGQAPAAQTAAPAPNGWESVEA